MAAWFVCALCAIVVIKPQEVAPALEAIPLLYVLFAAAGLASVFDVAYRRIHPAISPPLQAAFAFFAWALLTTALKRPDVFDRELQKAAIVLALLGVMNIALASESALRAFSIAYCACALLVSVIAIHQSSAPLGCMIAAPDDWEGRGELEHDGRSCETEVDCRKDAPNPDANYRCERVGLLGTSTIGGRVRYRGSLADPNELSLMVASAAPLGVALFERARKKRREGDPRRARGPLPLLVSDRLLERIASIARGIPAWGLVAVVATVVVLSKSRAGLLVFATFAFVTFVRRIGAWGVVATCFVAPGVILLGTGGRADTDASSDERMELLREALQFLRQTKGIGIGAGNFADESSIGMTAHNAYLLAAAETGIVGMILFGLFLYATLKVPAVVWLERRDTSGPVLGRLAPALAISLAAVALGIFFLSWTYKDVLYMLAGASAGLYGAARRRDPGFRIRIGAVEVAWVAVAMVGLLAAAYLVSRLWPLLD